MLLQKTMEIYKEPEQIPGIHMLLINDNVSHVSLKEIILSIFSFVKNVKIQC